MNIIEKPSPNFDSRDGHAVDMLVLHYTGMRTASEALERLCDAASKVSAHYMVDEDGTVYRLVPEGMRAWHAGVSSWRGNDNINQRSIGIEIVNPGHEFGYRPFPQAQMEAVAALGKDILSRHTIPARNVVGHSDIAPQRKEDPGELFNWKGLAKRGIGLWRDPKRSRWWLFFLWLDMLDVPILGTSKLSDILIDIFDILIDIIGYKFGNILNIVAVLPPYPEVQAKLAEYGYDCPQTGILDEATGKVILAFQRHFFPKRLTGKWDRGCALRLASLLSMV